MASTVAPNRDQRERIIHEADFRDRTPGRPSGGKHLTRAISRDSHNHSGGLPGRLRIRPNGIDDSPSGGEKDGAEGHGCEKHGGEGPSVQEHGGKKHGNEDDSG
jgi:hypothetical protein